MSRVAAGKARLVNVWLGNYVWRGTELTRSFSAVRLSPYVVFSINWNLDTVPAGIFSPSLAECVQNVSENPIDSMARARL